MRAFAVLALQSDRLSAVIGLVFLAVVVLSVIALVLATFTATRATSRTERRLTELSERVSALEDGMARHVMAAEVNDPSDRTPPLL